MTAFPEEYEAAERAYLEALASGQSASSLAVAAKAASDAARAWEAEAYKDFFAARDTQGGDARGVIEKEIAAEKAELLREVWADLAAAHLSAAG